ncbi:ATP-binding protein [Amycolatopsis sp. FBCC-B4732]|uniref:ATP-binding protein n=1 Tax=Amycolatopsis sp. FBCC-B4732 TaxID=3079339 RepID=UPI001FF306DD|nr:ATP-binding protein [Amycolatopsis sp. FBCC-B4732]UOX91807.1 ATP-binding protein [Amycolatopsis sp. FBCC-B4732]
MTVEEEMSRAVEELSTRVAAAAELTLDLSPRPLPRRVRSAVAECVGFGQPRDVRLGALLLVVDELVGNAYRHTGRPSLLRVTREQRGLLVEVSDEDPAIERVAAGGGHGLRLIDELSHGWGVRATASGKVVWALVPVHLLR